MGYTVFIMNELTIILINFYFLMCPVSFSKQSHAKCKTDKSLGPETPDGLEARLAVRLASPPKVLHGHFELEGLDGHGLSSQIALVHVSIVAMTQIGPQFQVLLLEL